jgi:hypothetical protein
MWSVLFQESAMLGALGRTQVQGSEYALQDHTARGDLHLSRPVGGADMPQKLSRAPQVHAIAGHQGRGVLNLAGGRRRVGSSAIRGRPQSASR